MHLEILSKEQTDLLPFIKLFRKTFYLVGGTAIALHLGHRRSIDFDLFTYKKLQKSSIKKKINESKLSISRIFEDIDQAHYLINQVKTTFFSFPYPVPHESKLDNIIELPSLLELAAMKAFALNRRAKWKDYVDLYFILQEHYSIQEISQKASEIFGQEFNEKLFREQLAFHKDINYSERVEYIVSAPDEEEIKAFLIDKAADYL
jgi:hypothetical protein